MIERQQLSHLQLLRTELSIVKIKLEAFSKASIVGVELALQDIEKAERRLGKQAELWIAELATNNNEAYCKIEDEFRQPI